MARGRGVDPPDLPPLTSVQIEDGPHDGLELTGAIVEREGRGIIVTAGLTIDECDLRGLNLEPGKISALSISDARLRECDLSNVHARRGEISRIAISHSRMVGFTLTDATMSDARVSDSTMMLASFGHSRLSDVVFEQVNLREASFLEARLDGVVFDGCDLAGADFRGVKLTNCAIRGTSLEGIVGIDSLNGLTMPWPDVVASAGALAHALGIVVESDDD